MRRVLVLMFAACSGKSSTTTTPPPPNRVDAAVGGCPASVTSPATDHCELGQRCPFSNGSCFCDGYHGGIPPRGGVDYSHWVCGKTVGRTDGCPDDLTVGAACKQPLKMCHPQEGMFCGPEITCTNGHWLAGIDDCSTIP